MSAHAHDMPVPRVPLLAAAALLVGTLAAVTAVRWDGAVPRSESRADVVAQRELRFEDRLDGRVVAIEGTPPTAVEQVVARPGEQGFLRGILRALARERRAAGAGADRGFVLSAHADGRLSLQDPVTGRRIDLESFGPANAAVFANLLARTTSHGLVAPDGPAPIRRHTP